jgi:beta-lactamase superfamily II metal-dependent hydrolase
VAYDGFEIAMLSLGRADSLLITRWSEEGPVRVLVDGGRKTHASIIRAFLEARGATWIDHVVCTHHDTDHASGLVELIKDGEIQFGKAWTHVPGLHVDRSDVDAALSLSAGSKKAQVVEGSLRTSDALLAAINDRDIPLEEPFRGKAVGFLTVCGPSECILRGARR